MFNYGIIEFFYECLGKLVDKVYSFIVLFVWISFNLMWLCLKYFRLVLQYIPRVYYIVTLTSPNIMGHNNFLESMLKFSRILPWATLLVFLEI